MIDTEALRKKIIDLAIRGQLTKQLPEDGNAEDLYVQIQEKKAKLIKDNKIKKEEPLPDISDDEIPFEIPENWKWVRAGEIVYVIGGTSYAKGDVSLNGIRILRGGNLTNSEVTYSDDDIFVPVKYSDKEKTIQKNDVLIVASTGSSTGIGKSGIVSKSDESAQIGAFLRIIRPCSKSVSQYVDLFYLSNEYVGRIRALAKGTNINNIKEKYITEMLLPLPPLPEQRRIVDKIDRAFAQISIIDSLQQQYESDCEILKGKIIDAGIRGRLTEQLPEDGNAEDLYAQIQEEKAKLIKEGKIKKEKSMPEISDDEIPFEIPNNWKWVRLKELGVFCGGKTPSMENKDYWTNGKISWVTSKDMKQKYIYSSQMLISETAAKELTVFPEKTVLFVVRSGILKRTLPVAVLMEKSTINQDLKALRLYLPEMCEYVYCIFKGFETKIIKRYTKDGTTVNNIVFDSLLTMPVPIPPLSEQKRIASRIVTISNLLVNNRGDYDKEEN